MDIKTFFSAFFAFLALINPIQKVFVAFSLQENYSRAELHRIVDKATVTAIGVLLLFCLIRAIRGPRIADRVISINMMGTLIVITICVLAFLMNEGYLVDIAMIYTMLSFLAVVLLTKIYMGVYREKRRRREATENQAKEGESHE